MARGKRDPARQINPRSVDPDTGELHDVGEERSAPRRSGFLAAVKRVARDAVVRRTSTKR